MSVPSFDLYDYFSQHFNKEETLARYKKSRELTSFMDSIFDGKSDVAEFTRNIGLEASPNLPIPEALKVDPSLKLNHLRKYLSSHSHDNLTPKWKKLNTLLKSVHYVTVTDNSENNGDGKIPFLINRFIYQTLDALGKNNLYTLLCNNSFNNLLSTVNDFICNGYHVSPICTDVTGQTLPNFARFVASVALCEAIYTFHENLETIIDEEVKADYGITSILLKLWYHCSEYVEWMLDEGLEYAVLIEDNPISNVCMYRYYANNPKLQGYILSIKPERLADFLDNEYDTLKEDKQALRARCVEILHEINTYELSKWLEWHDNVREKMSQVKTPSQLMKERTFLINHRDTFTRYPMLSSIRCEVKGVHSVVMSLDPDILDNERMASIGSYGSIKNIGEVSAIYFAIKTTRCLLFCLTAREPESDDIRKEFKYIDKEMCKSLTALVNAYTVKQDLNCFIEAFNRVREVYSNRLHQFLTGYPELLNSIDEEFRSSKKGDDFKNTQKRILDFLTRFENSAIKEKAERQKISDLKEWVLNYSERDMDKLAKDFITELKKSFNEVTKETMDTILSIITESDVESEDGSISHGVVSVKNLEGLVDNFWAYLRDIRDHISSDDYIKACRVIKELREVIRTNTSDESLSHLMENVILPRLEIISEILNIPIEVGKYKMNDEGELVKDSPMAVFNGKGENNSNDNKDKEVEQGVSTDFDLSNWNPDNPRYN